MARLPQRSRRTKLDLAVGALLVALVSIEWAAVIGVFEDGQRLVDPISYYGDAQFTATVVAAARRGDFLPFVSKRIESLGYPSVAQWNDFPLNEDVLYFAVGLLARPLGVFGAINVSFWAAAVLAALSMFWVCRRFRLSRPSAFVAGMLFGLSNFLFQRGVHHFSLLFFFIFPWLVLTAAYVTSRRGLTGGARRRIAVLSVLGGAWSMIYFAFFAAQLVALSVVSRFARWGRSQWTWSALVLLVGAVGLLSVEADTLAFQLSNGRNLVAGQREPSDVERFALKPVTFFSSANHRIEALRGLAGVQARQSMTSGEAPSPYLGAVGALTFVAMLGFLVVRLARGRIDLPARWALGAVFFTAMHGVGGINSVLGLVGLSMFRSVNRASVVVLCFTLLFGAWAFTRLTRRWKPLAVWALALPLGVLGALEGIPTMYQPGNGAQMKAVAESDRALVAQAERALPPGAKVFCLPAMEFPEAPPRGIDSHELFRPYFFAEHLVFSPGDVKGRPSAQWSLEVAQRPLPELFLALKEKGFDALYVNLRPYGGAAALAQFESHGATVIALAPLRDSAFLKLP